jgi:hypothetical protein
MVRNECINTESGVRNVGRSLAPGGHLFVDRGRVTISSDQVDNFGQDDIIVLILELVHRSQKAANLVVDARLGAGTSKVVHDRLNITM